MFTHIPFLVRFWDRQTQIRGAMTERILRSPGTSSVIAGLCAREVSVPSSWSDQARIWTELSPFVSLGLVRVGGGNDTETNYGERSLARPWLLSISTMSRTRYVGRSHRAFDRRPLTKNTFSVTKALLGEQTDEKMPQSWSNP
jgi:hypothetical protein